MEVLRRARLQRLGGGLIVALACIALAACGSSSKSNGGSGSGSSGPSVDMAAAKAGLAPYTGKASAFPVTDPLTKKPTGTFSYFQCSTPVCGLILPLLKGAAQTLGVKFQAVPAGASASAQATAVNSIIESKPTAMILPGIDVSPVCTLLKKLADSKVAISSFGVVNTAPCGIQAPLNGEKTMTLIGGLLADWAVEKKGADANIVFYNTPELGFSAFQKKGFDAEIAKICPKCKVRDATLSVTTYGSTAPSTVVSDLQSHAGTNVAVFPSLEAATGLPAALKTAGLNVLTIGTGPTPANLQDIKNGGITAAVGEDLPVLIWMTVDAAARVATGQALTGLEKDGTPPIQILEKQDITFDPSKGFNAYPDFAQRYAKLWKGQ